MSHDPNYGTNYNNVLGAGFHDDRAPNDFKIFNTRGGNNDSLSGTNRTDPEYLLRSPQLNAQQFEEQELPCRHYKPPAIEIKTWMFDGFREWCKYCNQLTNGENLIRNGSKLSGRSKNLVASSLRNRSDYDENNTSDLEMEDYHPDELGNDVKFVSFSTNEPRNKDIEDLRRDHAARVASFTSSIQPPEDPIIRNTTKFVTDIPIVNKNVRYGPQNQGRDDIKIGHMNNVHK